MRSADNFPSRQKAEFPVGNEKILKTTLDDREKDA